MRTSLITVGQELDILVEGVIVPSAQSVSAVRRDTMKTRKMASYKVKKGDTLLSIASSFGVTIKSLRMWNNLRGSRIRIGQELIINS